MSEISYKATKTLGSSAQFGSCTSAYKGSCIQIIVEYAAPIWHPYNDIETDMVEKVQRTAAM